MTNMHCVRGTPSPGIWIPIQHAAAPDRDRDHLAARRPSRSPSPSPSPIRRLSHSPSLRLLWLPRRRPRAAHRPCFRVAPAARHLHCQPPSTASPFPVAEAAPASPSTTPSRPPTLLLRCPSHSATTVACYSYASSTSPCLPVSSPSPLFACLFAPAPTCACMCVCLRLHLRLVVLACACICAYLRLH
jgi:hypothetical protein